MQGLMPAGASERGVPLEAMQSPDKATPNPIRGQVPHPSIPATHGGGASSSLEAAQAGQPLTADASAIESQPAVAVQQSDVVARALELVSQVTATFLTEPLMLTYISILLFGIMQTVKSSPFQADFFKSTAFNPGCGLFKLTMRKPGATHLPSAGSEGKQVVHVTAL